MSVNELRKNISYYTSERPELLSMLPSGVEAVLDVGCGAGNFGKRLKDKGVNRVVGVEINSEASVIAESRLDKVINTDIEGSINIVAGQDFDMVVFADVLEHLLDPWKVLSGMKKALKKSGYYLISIPNIRYHLVLSGLIFKGEFKYEEHGIMDSSHLRFFTLRMMKKYLDDAGFKIVKVKRNFSGPITQLLNMLCANIFADFATRQYIILAQRID